VARSPRTAAQLGLVELALGYWVAADDHLSEALAPASHPWIDRNRQVLQQSRSDARSHVAALVIEGQPAGAEISVNSVRAGTFPLSAPIRVGEGTVTIEARAPGRIEQKRVITVRGGATERLWLDLAPIPASERKVEAAPPPVVVVAPPPPAPVDSELPAWRRVLPWGLAGGAVLAAGVGVWQHVAWRQAQSDFEEIDACAADLPGHGNDDRCQGRYDTLSGRRTRAYVGYGVAGALGVGAAVMFLLNGSPESPGVAFGPGPTALGLSCRGAF
jgi:hypothetical protein